MTTLTAAKQSASEAISNVGSALVEARKKSSLYAVSYVQSVGIDERSGDLVSLTTLQAAEHYLSALEQEQAALAAYANTIRDVIALGREWHASREAKPPTLN